MQQRLDSLVRCEGQLWPDCGRRQSHPNLFLGNCLLPIKLPRPMVVSARGKVLEGFTRSWQGCCQAGSRQIQQGGLTGFEGGFRAGGFYKAPFLGPTSELWEVGERPGRGIGAVRARDPFQRERAEDLCGEDSRNL